MMSLFEYSVCGLILLTLTAIYSGREMYLKLEPALSQTSVQLNPERSIMEMQ